MREDITFNEIVNEVIVNPAIGIYELMEVLDCADSTIYSRINANGFAGLKHIKRHLANNSKLVSKPDFELCQEIRSLVNGLNKKIADEGLTKETCNIKDTCRMAIMKDNRLYNLEVTITPASDIKCFD